MGRANWGGAAARGSGTDSVTAGLVRSVISWCDALNGSVSLTDALADLVVGLGAEAGMIVRTNLADLRPVAIANVDLAHAIPQLRQSYADRYFGRPMASARVATTWFASQHQDDCTGDPALAEWQSLRRMKEFAVFVLAVGGMTRDHVELHFRERLSVEMEGTLAAMLPEMSRVWGHRRVGLVTRSIANHRSTNLRVQAAPRNHHILSSDNPAQLSRAEFRVCLLLARGLLVQAVARELDLSEPTIRTHLRNIYAKTDCSCLAEVVFRLMDGRPQFDLLEAKPA